MYWKNVIYISYINKTNEIIGLLVLLWVVCLSCSWCSIQTRVHIFSITNVSDGEVGASDSHWNWLHLYLILHTIIFFALCVHHAWYQLMLKNCMNKLFFPSKNRPLYCRTWLNQHKIMTKQYHRFNVIVIYLVLHTIKKGYQKLIFQ